MLSARDRHMIEHCINNDFNSFQLQDLYKKAIIDELPPQNLIIQEMLNYCEDDTNLMNLVDQILKIYPRKYNVFESLGATQLEQDGDAFATSLSKEKAEAIYHEALGDLPLIPKDFKNLILGRLNRKLGELYFRQFYDLPQAREHTQAGLSHLSQEEHYILNKIEYVKLIDIDYRILVAFNKFDEIEDFDGKLQKALALLPPEQPMLIRGNILELLGIFNRIGGERAQFREYMNKAKKIFMKVGAEEQRCRIIINLASDDIAWGMPQESIDILLEDENKRVLKQSPYWSTVCLNLSIAYTDLNNLVEAKLRAEESLELCKNDNDILGQIMALGSLAEIYKEQIKSSLSKRGKAGSFRNCRRVKNKSVGIIRKRDKEFATELADQFRIFADACILMEDFDEAQKQLAQSKKYSDLSKGENPLDKPKLKMTKAQLYYNLNKAGDLMRQAIDDFKDLKEWKEVVPAQITLAKWYCEQEQYKDAENILIEAQDYSEQEHCEHRLPEIEKMLEKARNQEMC